ncbi:MAG: class I SAM-dependent methyltransferase [Bacteroidota bacterium]
MVIGEFSFKRFAQQQFYREVNQRLIQLSGIQPGQHVVDLACGVGTVTGMILQKLQGAKDSVVIAIDTSAEELQLAREALEKVGKGIVRFVQGSVEQLSQIARERADTVFFCNAIHLIQDKTRLVAEVYDLLPHGGMFAFNTAFFDGAIPSETEQFYRRWMLKAIRFLNRQYNLMPQKAPKVEARKPLTPEQYVELLERQNFALRHREICPVAMPLEGWLGISQYEEFISGALRGIPLEQGCHALQEGVRQTFQEMNLEAVPRNWLSVVAIRQ